MNEKEKTAAENICMMCNENSIDPGQGFCIHCAEYTQALVIGDVSQSDKQEDALYAEWGGTALCFTSYGRIVNIADELNKIERRKIQQNEGD